MELSKDEIIRMAREAGFPVDEHGYNTKRIERFAALVSEHWIETNKELAKEIIELKKQTEQRSDSEQMEPVAVVEITYGREPECYVTGNIDDFPEGVFKLYASPVRIKDLTDKQIEKVWNKNGGFMGMPIDFARAVIQEYRRKNGIV